MLTGDDDRDTLYGIGIRSSFDGAARTTYEGPRSGPRSGDGDLRAVELRERQHARAESRRQRRDAPARAELPVDVVEVGGDGPLGHAEPSADLSRGQAFGGRGEDH